MVFSSPLFLFAFLPVALAGWLLLPRRWRLFWLFIVNLIFYGWGEPVYLLVMLAVTLINFAAGRLIERCPARSSRAKVVLAISTALSLGALGYFKYAGLIVEALRLIPGLRNLPAPDVALPIGISFYTFQALSYAVDVYRGDTPAQKSPLVFSVYVTLFPQLIAGPIVRYRDVAAQLDGHHAGAEEFSLGVRRFVCGLSKKLLIANPMGLMWDQLRPLAGTGGTLAGWLGLIAYSLQIYFDFSGYSDMAIGLGHMLGLTFLENFNYPYISKSITEFWRRWHISLSAWFRDYVYIPLGGNRAGRGRTFFNLFAVWALTGLWHGASVNFILWGLYYFVLLSLERLGLKKLLDRSPAVIGHLYTLLCVALGWALFYFDGGAGEAVAFMGRLFSFDGLLRGRAVNIALRYLPLMAAAAFAATPLPSRLRTRVHNEGARAALDLILCGLGLILCAAAMISQSYNPFLYFKF